MNTYKGKAFVVRSDDADIPVTADLRSYVSGLRTGWDGILTATLEGAKALANLTDGRLRLADGGEAEFLRPDTADWVAANQLRVMGQGEAPFQVPIAGLGLRWSAASRLPTRRSRSRAAPCPVG